MADLSFAEKRTIESQLIQGGYVLNFNNATFREFVADTVGKDMDDPIYSQDNSGSKGNRLKMFIKLESDYLVGKLLAALLPEIISFNDGVKDAKSYDEYSKIAERLTSGKIVDAIDAIQANNDDKDFKQLAKLITECIEKNEPEAALDRLHTFCFKFLKELCDHHGVVYDKEESLNAIYGKYIKAIREKGFIESEMAAKIVSSTFQVMQAFNDIRNNKSFAHDNPVLNYDESILIFRYISSTIQFIQSMEAKHKNDAVADATADWGDF